MLAPSPAATAGRQERGGSPPTRAGRPPPAPPTPGPSSASQAATWAIAYDCAGRRRSPVAPCLRSARSYSSSSTSRPERSPARKASTGSVRWPPRPVERTRAPSAIRAAPRSPRCDSRPVGAQTLPPTVAPARTSLSAMCAAYSARSGSAPPASEANETIAPIRTTPFFTPSRSSPLRCSISARSGFNRPAAMSGRRIVPPANTVMPSPSPYSDAASSAEPGRSTSTGTAAILFRSPAPGTSYAGMRVIRLDRRARDGARAGLLPAGPRAGDGALPVADAREAAPPRGGGGRRQDRGRQVDGGGARRAADPPPVLRGPRRRARGLRVELHAAAAAHPGRAGGNGRRVRALRPRVPDPAAAARGGRGGAARPAADRRGRSRGRGVRGVPARGALGLPDHDPGARDDRGEAAPVRDPHLQQDPRAPRRAQAALPLPLDRPPVGRARDRHRARARAGRAGAARRGGGPLRGRAARPRPPEAAGARGDHRLGAGADGARPPGARRRACRSDAGRGAQVPRGPALDPRRSAGGPRRERTC